MLVIISDLHLTDGSSGETVHQGTLRVFRERLRNLAYAASWRSDGKYRPIESLAVVLLGDTIDVLRSSRWLRRGNGEDETVRPWDNPLDERYAKKVANITDAILHQNATFFALLREVRSTSVATVPRAVQNGAPSAALRVNQDTERVRVRVRIYYMAGNHDWYFHLPYAPYDAIRRTLVSALGLENDPTVPFPHDPEEPGAAAIREVFEQHHVFARHGDIFDPFNYAGNRDASSLGDAIVIDLVMRFVTEVRTQLSKSLPPQLLARLKDVDNVRPLLMAPVWVGGTLRQTCADPRLRREVQQVWNDVADRFVRNPFVRDQLKVRHGRRHAEKLRLALALSRRALLPGSSWLLRRLAAGGGARRPSYCGYALREPAFRKRQARFIVYGHTHQHEMVPLDSIPAGDDSGNQIYFNSGTWRPVYELTHFKPEHESFAGYNTMTYLAFFRDGERSGRPFESWSGNLGRSQAMKTNSST
ncbi:MAG: hypothetical protein ACRD11_03425 [Terriglobia bacterium]